MTRSQQHRPEGKATATCSQVAAYTRFEGTVGLFQHPPIDFSSTPEHAATSPARIMSCNEHSYSGAGPAMADPWRDRRSCIVTTSASKVKLPGSHVQDNAGLHYRVIVGRKCAFLEREKRQGTLLTDIAAMEERLVTPDRPLRAQRWDNEWPLQFVVGAQLIAAYSGVKERSVREGGFVERVRKYSRLPFLDIGRKERKRRKLDRED